MSSPFSTAGATRCAFPWIHRLGVGTLDLEIVSTLNIDRVATNFGILIEIQELLRNLGGVVMCLDIGGPRPDGRTKLGVADRRSEFLDEFVWVREEQRGASPNDGRRSSRTYARTHLPSAIASTNTPNQPMRAGR